MSEAPSTVSPPPPPARRRRRHVPRFLLRLVLLVAVPLIAALAGGAYYMTTGRYVSTDNAYVKAPLTAITAEVSGRVKHVAVTENQRVALGDVLLELDREEFEIAATEAQAALASIAQELERRRAAVRQARGVIELAKERITYLTTQFGREKVLQARGIGTPARYEEARHELRAAKRSLEVAREKENELIAGLGGNVKLPTERHPLYLAAMSRLNRVKLDLARTLVRAPAAGIVARVTLEIGEYVEDGKALFALVHSDKAWIEANLKETELTYVRAGQVATFVADAYPDRTWQATVIGISPATGAEFALLPPQNASGNWVKVVQRLPVRLAIEQLGDGAGPALRAGMTVTVSIDTKRQRQWPAVISDVLAYTRNMVGQGRDK